MAPDRWKPDWRPPPERVTLPREVRSTSVPPLDAAENPRAARWDVSLVASCVLHVPLGSVLGVMIEVVFY
ncbi:MAG: hypothetical protein ACI841_002787 [Planctomycetota bacterium]|jgi:hypothetical protein